MASKSSSLVFCRVKKVIKEVFSENGIQFLESADIKEVVSALKNSTVFTK